MANLYNLEMHWPNFDKAKAKFANQKPRWSAMFITKDKAQAKEIEALGIKVNPNIPDEGAPYWSFNVGKNETSAKSGAPNPPVKIVDINGNPAPNNNIGNGTIVNIRMLEREYTNLAGKPAMAYTLMAVQIVKLIKYEAPARDSDFPETKRPAPEYVNMDDGDMF
jgi:hypothetical protein